MNKKIVIIGLLFLTTCIVAKLLYLMFKNIKVDDFHKAAIIFVVDSSASNQKMLPIEIKYLKSLCSILDPEDAIKILKVSQSSYLIYEGTPSDSSGITNSLGAFTKYEAKEFGTAYGLGIKKLLNIVLQ